MNPQNPDPQNPVPPTTNEQQPQIVYMARPLEPQAQEMSPEIQKKHEDSKRQYPNLNLSNGEYVISSIRRHPIGLVSIWIVTILVILGLIGAVFVLQSLSSSSDLEGVNFPIMYLMIPVVLISMLAVLFAFISAYIYNANHFYLTNESIIQHIQNSLFSKREQTVSLANVEDASFSQDGIFPHMFDYGMIRLSTQGDETTYRFSFASSPQKQIVLLNNAVENFKNVRPIEH